jgi:hypothetical protein
MTSSKPKSDSAKAKKIEVKTEIPANLPPIKPVSPQRPPQQPMRGPQRMGGARPMRTQKADRKR